MAQTAELEVPRIFLLPWLHCTQQALLNAVFPPRCAGCSAFCRHLFCVSCLGELKPIVAPFCKVCGLPFDPEALAGASCAACRDNRYHGAPPYSAIRSCYRFEGPVRKAVHALKYRGRTVYAAPMASLLVDLLLRDQLIKDAQLSHVIPVPLHPWRRWRRGFNQTELLAKPVARQLGLPLADILQRRRFTASQVGLNRTQRAANVQGAFLVRPGQEAALRNARILLVDDVFTTGATLAECALVLRESGAREVFVVTLAREA